MLPVSQAIAARAAGLLLTSADQSRYSRHILLPEVGLEGQKRLRAARILIIGAGGLGSPSSLYLAAAGVGTIGIVEFDTVDQSNLQRQILYVDADTGRPKIKAALERLRALAPSSQIVAHAERLSVDNIARIFADYDIIVDGTDNFPTRYLASDACVLLGKPYVYGSIFRFDGQASVFYTPHGPCYRCLFPAPPPPGQAPSCAEAGVLGVLPGQIGTIQATEALKLALGIGESLLGRLMTLDALSMRFDEFRLRRDPNCPACGERPTITTLQESAASCEVERPLNSNELIAALELKRLREQGGTFRLLDVRTAGEAAICRIAGSELIPMAELPAALAGLPRDVEFVVHCKSGARSARAVRMMKDAGFARVRSLEGGILAWISACEPGLSRY